MKKKLPFLFSILLLSASIQAQNTEWSFSAGDNSPDYIRDMAIDEFGNTYVVGHFKDRLILHDTLQSQPSHESDVFIAKLDPNGAPLWAVSAIGAGDDEARSMAIDQDENVYIAGVFKGSINFGDGKINSKGQEDIFIAKYDRNGELLWAKGYGSSTGPDLEAHVAVSEQGQVYLTGYYFGAIDFDGKSLNATNSNTDDVFLVQFDSDGTPQWAKTMGGAGQDQANDVATDAQGNAYITGMFTGTADFAGTQLSSRGLTDIFIAKFNASGDQQWVKEYGGADLDAGTGLDCDNNGNVYLTGYFTHAGDTVHFDTQKLYGYHAQEVFALQVNSSGAVQWVTLALGTGDDIAHDVMVDENGNTYIIGNYETELAVSGTFTNATNSGDDVFIIKLDELGDLAWIQGYDGSSNDDGRAITSNNRCDIFIAGSFESSIDLEAGVMNSNGAEDIFVASINVTNKATIKGMVTDAQGSVGDQEVTMYLYHVSEASRKMRIEATTTTDVTGYYEFKVAAGDYLVAAKPSKIKLPNAVVTYSGTASGTTHYWDSAQVYSSYCGSDETVNLQLIETVPLSGPGTIRGEVLENQGFEKGPGDPVPAVEVGLEIIPPGGKITAQAVTDANGVYEFDSLPKLSENEFYRVYVNIPGLESKMTYLLVINDLNLLIEDVNFCADFTSIDTCRDPLSVQSVGNKPTVLNIYPNPSNGTINMEYEVKQATAVRFEIYNALGALVHQHEEGIQAQGLYQYRYDLSQTAWKQGIYFVKVSMGNEHSLHKISYLK